MTEAQKKRSALGVYSQSEIDIASWNLVLLIDRLERGKTAIADPAERWKRLVESHAYKVVESIARSDQIDRHPKCCNEPEETP